MDNLEGGDRVSVPVNEAASRHLDPDRLSLTRKRIDHPRLPPLADVQSGKPVHRAEDVLNHAPRFVVKRHVLVKHRHFSARHDFHRSPFDLTLYHKQRA